MNQLTLSQQYPGGCFIGFNAAIDRKTAEQLSLMCSDAIRNGYRELALLISSSGGILDHTHYVCNVLDALPVRIKTFNVGGVSSAANLLFLCGDERYAVEGATFFFHQTHYPPPPEQVTGSFARSRAKAILRDDIRSANYVSGKTGCSSKDVMKWQRGELFMDTKAALANRIIHGIQAPSIPPDAFFHQIVV